MKRQEEYRAESLAPAGSGGAGPYERAYARARARRLKVALERISERPEQRLQLPLLPEDRLLGAGEGRVQFPVPVPEEVGRWLEGERARILRQVQKDRLVREREREGQGQGGRGASPGSGRGTRGGGQSSQGGQSATGGGGGRGGRSEGRGAGRMPEIGLRQRSGQSGLGGKKDS